MDAGATNPPQVIAAAALGSLAAARSLVAALAPLDIPVMVLKGPPLQRRLLGTDCAYQSADIDLLVPAHQARTVRRLLRSQGWAFLPENGSLWWVDRAAAFTRDGVTIDLHWGIHAGTLGALRLRSLERALWDGATRSSEGWLEPLPEPLVVYLAVNWAGHHYEGSQRLASVEAAASLVTDWERARAIARRARVSAVLEHALAHAGGAVTAHAPPLVRQQTREVASRVVALARTRRPETARRALLHVRARLAERGATKPGERQPPGQRS